MYQSLFTRLCTILTCV